MRMITGSLLLVSCLHVSFTGRVDQYATFKKMKSQKKFYGQYEYGTAIRRHMVI